MPGGEDSAAQNICVDSVFQINIPCARQEYKSKEESTRTRQESAAPDKDAIRYSWNTDPVDPGPKAWTGQDQDQDQGDRITGSTPRTEIASGTWLEHGWKMERLPGGKPGKLVVFIWRTAGGINSQLPTLRLATWADGAVRRSSQMEQCVQGTRFPA